MKPIYIIALILVFSIAALIILSSLLTIKPIQQNQTQTLSEISLPPRFSISVYAELGSGALSLPGPNPGPRMMLVRSDALFVSVPSQGRIIALRDLNDDGRADNLTVFLGQLDNPHGIDYSDGWYYIAQEDGVVRARDDNHDLVADDASIENLTNLPSGGGHYTRTVKVKDGYMYISIGSTCNVCHEEHEWRATIVRCKSDGSDCSVYAKGLRNSVGLAFHPDTGELYATENGRDFLGEDIPPDEINLIKEGGNYGWPICYGKNMHDTEFDKNVYIRNPCEEPFETESLIDLQAHSAPLGLVFYNGTMFPKEYLGKLFVAYHGSWNRKVPTGYKIVTVDLEDGSVTDFATGWLQNSSVLGRPVDVAVGQDGSLLISDDAGGKIYRVKYAN